MKAYKQFRIDKSGNLHPLFVFAGEVIRIGEWLTAKAGDRDQKGKVKSKLGPLAYRPGWHLSEIPYAPHIGVKENGVVRYMKPDTVWAECEVYDKYDYTNCTKMTRNGLDILPEDGFYWFKTNPNAYGRWLIAHKIKVNRILTDAEVEDICWQQFGIHAQERKAV